MFHQDFIYIISLANQYEEYYAMNCSEGRSVLPVRQNSEKSVSTFSATVHVSLYSLNFLYALRYDLYYVVFILILLINMWNFKNIVKNK